MPLCVGSRLGILLCCAFALPGEVLAAPIAGWTARVGSPSVDFPNAMAIGPDQSVYVVGKTGDATYPVTAGAYDGTHNGFLDMVVTKLSPAGDSLVWSTFIGGSATDEAHDAAVDGDGNLYVVGLGSQNFPMVNSPQPTPGTGWEMVAVKLSPSGALLWSAYLGGSGDDGIPDRARVAIEPDGNLLVLGTTTSTNLATTAGADGTIGGTQDLLVARLAGDGSSVMALGYIGGSGVERSGGIAVSATGRIYVSGMTTSTDFPALDGFQRAPGGGNEAFVAELDRNSLAPIRATLLGGGNADEALEVKVSRRGEVVVVGKTFSANFPVVHGFDDSFGGGEDGFLARLTGDLTALLSASFVGGAGTDHLYDLELDPADRARLSGHTNSTDIPLVLAPDTSLEGDDSYLATVSEDGHTLLWATYWGGNFYDEITDVRVGPSCRTFALGHSQALPGTYQYGARGEFDFLVGHWDQPDGTAPTTGFVTARQTLDASTLSESVLLEWTGFEDPESGITDFQWAIGTAPGLGDASAFRSAGRETFDRFSPAVLVSDRTYFATVRAANCAGLTQSSFVELRLERPIAGPIMVACACSGPSASLGFSGAWLFVLALVRRRPGR